MTFQTIATIITVTACEIGLDVTCMGMCLLDFEADIDLSTVIFYHLYYFLQLSALSWSQTIYSYIR